MNLHPSSFTLVETLIAFMIFLILSTTSIVFLSQASKADRKVEMEEYLYTETQALIERIRQTIQGSAIDYEEYYNQIVMGEATYGINYGCYQANFFDPISGFETGQNPYSGNPEDSNVRCKGHSYCSAEPSYHQFNWLYLLNTDGSIKTSFLLAAGAIHTVELEGFDTDSNGLFDTWSCADDFTCTASNPEEPSSECGKDVVKVNENYKLPNFAELNENTVDNDDFVPISSSNITITDFKVYLSPIEDPYKAYNESSDAVFDSVQNHPKVIVRLTAEYRLLDSAGNEIPWESSADSIGKAPSITLQRSINTGVYRSIPSYAP